MATADWLYNYPRGRIFPPFVWQRSKRFFRRDAGFFAPPLPTPTKEKPICENFIRPRVNRRKGSKVSIIRTFLEYIICFCCFESLSCITSKKSDVFFLGFVVSPSISNF